MEEDYWFVILVREFVQVSFLEKERRNVFVSRIRVLENVILRKFRDSLFIYTWVFTCELARWKSVPSKSIGGRKLLPPGEGKFKTVIKDVQRDFEMKPRERICES